MDFSKSGGKKSNEENIKKKERGVMFQSGAEPLGDGVAGNVDGPIWAQSDNSTASGNDNFAQKSKSKNNKKFTQSPPRRVDSAHPFAGPVPHTQNTMDQSRTATNKKHQNFSELKKTSTSAKDASKSVQKTKSFENKNLVIEKDKSPIAESLGNLSISNSDCNTGSNINFKDTKWSELGVKKALADVLESRGFMFPSAVQAKSIPSAIEGRDLLIRAKNGAGKTASFVIPILNRINVQDQSLQAIVLVPIRELALQISKTFVSLGRALGIRSMPIVGGSVLTDDIIRLNEGAHVLIGTPGRVVDLLSKKLCTLDSIPIIVFDEADKLLDSVFFEPIYQFMNLLPPRRQMLLYSATFPESIEGFVTKYMDDPLKIKVGDGKGLENVKQYFVRIESATKLACLRSLLSSLKIDQCIIYCSSIANVKHLAHKIMSLGLSSYFIHSQMDQEERNVVYHNFSKGKCKILVSTDITTRGINVPQVNVVINFDLPFTSESYLHRVGRAGRFGADGCSITLVDAEEKPLLDAYAESLGVNILTVSHPSFKAYCQQ